MNDSTPYSCGGGLFAAERPNFSDFYQSVSLFLLINGWKERGRHAARSPAVKCVSCRLQSKRVALAVKIRNAFARHSGQGAYVEKELFGGFVLFFASFSFFLSFLFSWL